MDPQRAVPDGDVRAVRRRAEATPARADPVANPIQNLVAMPRGSGVTRIARNVPPVTAAAAVVVAEAPAAAARETPAVVRVRGVMIRGVSVLVVLGGSLVLGVVLVVRVRGAMTPGASADRATVASRTVARVRPAQAVVAAEMMTVAEVAAVIARRPMANLAAAAARGTATVRRAHAEAAVIALGATGQAMTLIRRRAVHLARRPRTIVAVMVIAAVLLAIDPIRIALRSGARRVGPLPDLRANLAGNHADPDWSSPRIWICNNSRAVYAPSCGV